MLKDAFFGSKSDVRSTKPETIPNDQNSQVGGCHAQFHAFGYFGVLPVLLVVMAFIKIRGGKVTFWLAFLFVSSMAFLLVQPFIDIMYLLFFPLVHTIIPKMMIPLALCAVLGHSGKYMESNYGELNRKDIVLLVVSG
jgi:hypothetical protein